MVQQHLHSKMSFSKCELSRKYAAPKIVVQAVLLVSSLRSLFLIEYMYVSQLQEGHEKVAEQISRDVSQLCSQLAALWSHFLETAVLNPFILSYLAQEHHTLRVSRKQKKQHKNAPKVALIVLIQPDFCRITVSIRTHVAFKPCFLCNYRCI